MEPFRCHVFVCNQVKPEGVTGCAAQGAGEVIEALNREIEASGLTDAVQVTICGSLGLCEHGPNLVVYPEGIWYSGLTPLDVAEIVKSHLRDGIVVEGLARMDNAALRAAAFSHPLERAVSCGDTHLFDGRLLPQQRSHRRP